MSRSEDAFDGDVAVVEDFTELRGDEHWMNKGAERAEGWNVVDQVAAFDASVAKVAEEMFVVPDFVGADALFIDEVVRRFDAADFGEPGHGKSEQRAHTVLDHESAVHDLGHLAEDLEIEGFRRDGAQVVWIGKKVPAFRDGGADDLGALQFVDWHVV